ncbi:hypothetical protein CBR_g38775 [Chara braunii]|uniref:fructose-bisphosphatase n=1 Tax=Chara braunii TaxID=69332 RepID=A0A388LQL9_CHABU|nr:hypothetical protein CBR_g38775 [Chara braunii]|eukprot:GBG84492.1 hypothetical protein CBR_g38775 [Chara braunii]
MAAAAATTRLMRAVVAGTAASGVASGASGAGAAASSSCAVRSAAHSCAAFALQSAATSVSTSSPSSSIPSGSTNAAPGARRALASARRNSASSSVAARAAVSATEAAPETTKKRSAYAITTLTNWLLQQEFEDQIDNELTVVLTSIAVACKQIASLVQRAGITNLTGVQGAVNVQGEDQKKLDVVSNEVFSSCLRSSGRTGIIASEEEDVPVAVEESYSGNYIVVFDPLDGSSNIDAAVSTGSIFGIYRPQSECIVSYDEDEPTELDSEAQNCVVEVCQPGTNLLAAGYCMYSSSIIFVLSVGNGVYGFTLDPSLGEFVLTHDGIKVPPKGQIYSFNEGNYEMWDDKLKTYISDLKKPGDNGKPYSARYIGSLVGDFHRTLLYGGIYGYPRDAKSTNGKLRLLYECAPMSYLAEQAGGRGSDGYTRVLDIIPEQVHQRIPLFVGSAEEVEKLESYLKQ